jgi:anti-sigma-K factor RskA
VSIAEHELIAGEYALGLLTEAEGMALEARMADDRALAASVQSWRERLAPLDDLAPAIMPSDDLWTRIEAATYRPDPARGLAHPATPRPAGAPARLWASFRFRRAVVGYLLFVSFAGPLAVAVAIAVRPPSASPPPASAPAAMVAQRSEPDLMAVLLNEQQQPFAVVQGYSGQRAQLLALNAALVPEGRALEVWAVVPGADKPLSVAVLATPSGAPLRLAPEWVRPDLLFQVTLEPAGGSPTGLPTGPLIGGGKLQEAL